MMKITETNPYINMDAYSNKIESNSKINRKETNKDIQETKTDEVKLSPLVNEVYKAQENIKEIPDINEGKVSQIRMELENGTYQINNKGIASKMMQESLINALL